MTAKAPKYVLDDRSVVQVRSWWDYPTSEPLGTLYLLDQDAESVFQQAGIKPVVFPVRLSLIESVSFYDAFGEVKNVPGMEMITELLGGKKEDIEMPEAKGRVRLCYEGDSFTQRGPNDHRR